jgi:cyclic beta-1,2-glucan synthetase
VAVGKAAREAANWVCDHEAALAPAQIDALFAQAQARGVEPVFLAQMIQRLRGPLPTEASRWQGWLEQHAPDADAVLAAAQEAQAADNVSVSNAVTALRAINNVDWVELVEAVSPVLQALRQVPAFAADSRLTRDQVAHEIERLARRLRRSEAEVARRVADLCRGSEAQPDQGPAHWTIGPGRPVLLAALGADAAQVERAASPWWQRWRTSLYAGALGLGVLGLLAWLVDARQVAGGPGAAALVLALVLMSFPALECVVALVHRMLAESVRVHRLPRLGLNEPVVPGKARPAPPGSQEPAAGPGSLRHGLQPEHRTLLVVPCLLTSPAAIEALAERLELHHLATRQPQVQYALLSDWPDAPQAEMSGDAALLNAAQRAIEWLNEKHPAAPDAPPRFLLLHRPRTWCESENAWMGWERKRGKIEQLLAVLAEGASPSPFMDLGATSRLADAVRYVAVLDSDTELPPAALAEMVAVAAHPLNAPRIDPVTRRVVAGYGIFQPRVAQPYPSPAEITAYGWMFAGPWGTDAYNGGSSEIYQDVFGEGSFFGKGLFNVQAVHEVLRERVAPDRLLSHDLFEGLWARCAYLSDVAVFESHPMHPDVAASRQHRWTRGDWQLLAFIGAVIGGGVGGLNVWKVLDNLRRSLLAPACVALLWLAFATHVLRPGVAVALVAASLGLGSLIGAATALVPSRAHIALGHLWREALRELLRAAAAAVWQTATLMRAAGLQLDAIARALWRMAVTRRQLLQWTTAAQAQASASLRWAWFWRRHVRTSIAALLWAGTGLLMPQAAAGWLAAFGAIWALTPVWLWAAAQPLRRGREHTLGADQRAYLEALARDTWSYFETCVTAEDHDLPPDNLQIEPRPMLAHRTSPTNIGLYLLSAVCARRLGLLGTEALAGRIDRSFATLRQLPTHRGHFYNWVDTQTLRTLPPPYVSTVDSGNLAACLWTLAQACREWARAEEPAAAAAWLARAAQADAFVAAMDFGFLYDRKRRLFHIGYRESDAALDPAYYDLLASEARLTSYVAIAKGDVPRRHWEALGRPFLSFEGRPTLRSWSGSMFEYLMPSLLMSEPHGGLLQRVLMVAVAAQRDFGAQHGIPWGVSECAYFAQDHTLAFQYSPFGVPCLALRRTPADDRVIAPYATVLATLVDAPAAIDNLRRIEAAGGRGVHGFIEALDFSRQPLTEPPQRVATFMAHHQGMSLVALCDVLAHDAARGWFSRAPQVKACEALLHERMPREIVLQVPTLMRAPHEVEARTLPLAREIDPAQPAALPPTVWLSNGRYSVNLRPSGAGQSRWRGRAVSRARDDALRDAHGTWLMLRCAGDAAFHSLTYAPHPRPQAVYRTRCFNDHVEFLSECERFEAMVSVWVSADEDVEFRRVQLHNLTNAEQAIELMSYFEAALAPQAADESHPAFSNLFVQAHAADPRCALLERKPRLHGEAGLWVAHFLAACDVEPASVRVCCNREQLLPRRGSLAQLRAAPEPQVLPDGRLDTGLDPVASLTVALRVPPRARVTITFATAAASESDPLLAIMDEFRHAVHIARDQQMAAALARIRQHELRVDAADLQAVQDLGSLVAMSRSRLRALPPTAADRRALWRFGISGDKPIVVVRLGSAQGLAAVHALMAAQRLWEIGGLPTDLVVINGEPGSYLMPLQQALGAMHARLGAGQHEQPERGGVHLLRQIDISQAEAAALVACARIDLVADGRPLARLLAPALGQRVARHPAIAHDAGGWPEAWAPSRFDEGGRVFAIELNAAQITPRPWANVIANPQFGCLVTESGGGFTWALNSRMNQLTPWSNDALLDPPGEQFLVHDGASERWFGLLPTLERNGSAGYEVRHTQGASEFTQQRDGLVVRTTVSVHPAESVKCLHVRLRNESRAGRTLRLVGWAEWILGAQRRDRMTLATEYLPDLQAVIARQLEHQGGFGEGTAFLMLSGVPVRSWTCVRSAFFDAQGGCAVPAQLPGVAGYGLDPCGGLDAVIELAAGKNVELCWAIGYAPGRDAALSLARRMRLPGALEAVAEQSTAAWNDRLGAITVHTPDPLFDAMVNRWWLYQAVGCRMWAKTGFYQASGATGFRDQLQDAMALAWSEPQALRAQILLHASRQFPQGDVQHWWHSPTGAGVRTRFSDDLLWLPYVTAHYLASTGDDRLLDEPVPFLEGAAVPAEAEDAYYVPTTSGESATLYEHAARAIDQGLRFGEHGLPLMGTGDWNDGMNRVGHEGRGESVWLGWFLLALLPAWEQLALRRQDAARAQAWGRARVALEEAMQTAGWDGEWYRRAYFDDGTPLGSCDNAECSIDLIAQAWSAFVLPPDDERAGEAMASADRLLVDREHGLVRLLAPPLQHSAHHAGYIQAYPPGVRENGGQYSHAGSWAVLAQARLGHAGKAWEYFCMLSAAHRARHESQQRRYGLEPYVMAGDTYAAPPYEGRGGWSWYSGAAAWMWRAAVEGLLGLQRRGSSICLKPCLPPHWAHVSLTLALPVGPARPVQVVLQRMPAVPLTGAISVQSGQWVDLDGLADAQVLWIGVPRAEATATRQGLSTFA